MCVAAAFRRLGMLFLIKHIIHGHVFLLFQQEVIIFFCVVLRKLRLLPCKLLDCLHRFPDGHKKEMRCCPFISPLEVQLQQPFDRSVVWRRPVDHELLVFISLFDGNLAMLQSHNCHNTTSLFSIMLT